MLDIQAMFPVMVVSDLSAIKAFYESVFGFSAVFFQADFYLHLVHPNTGIQLGFLVPEHASQPSFLHSVMQPEGYVLSFEVADAKALFEQAQQLELKLAMPLKQEAWGQLHFMIEDPAGIKIDIVEHQQQSTD